MALEIQVTFDVADLDRMAAFWALALGYEPEPPPDGFASWEEFAQRNHIPRECLGAVLRPPW